LDTDLWRLRPVRGQKEKQRRKLASNVRVSAGLGAARSDEFLDQVVHLGGEDGQGVDQAALLWRRSLEEAFGSRALLHDDRFSCFRGYNGCPHRQELRRVWQVGHVARAIGSQE